MEHFPRDVPLKFNILQTRFNDPTAQHRVFMEVAWAAVENAGCAPRSGLVQNTGVFAASGID